MPYRGMMLDGDGAPIAYKIYGLERIFGEDADRAIRLMLISLAITPLARGLDWPGLLLVRRNIGVAAACYAVAHLFLWVVEQNFMVLAVVAEIALRFYLTIGFVSLLVLLALAITSTDGWVNHFGGTGSGCTVWLTRSARSHCCISIFRRS